MAERLTERGYEVVEAESGERALEFLDQFAFDIVITDLRLPGIDGTRVIEAARERYPGIVAIVITGYGTVKDAVGRDQAGRVGLHRQAVSVRRARATCSRRRWSSGG